MKYCTSLVESSEDADWMVRMILQTGEEPRWITRVLRPIEVLAEELLLSIEVELAKKSMLFWARTRLLERLNCLSTRSSLGSNKVRFILPSIKTKKRKMISNFHDLEIMIKYRWLLISYQFLNCYYEWSHPPFTVILNFVWTSLLECWLFVSVIS